MPYSKALISESEDTSYDSDGRPVIEIRESYEFFDDTMSYVHSHQAKDNFRTFASIREGTAHPSFAAAICKRIHAEKKSTIPPHQAWKMDIEWSTDAPKPDDPDPSKRRWKRDVSTSEQTRYIIKDKNEKLIVDAAGSPFDGGIPKTVQLQTFNFSHNVDASVYPLNSVDYSGYLNSDTWAGKAPYTCLMLYSAKEDFEGKYHFWEETFTIIYDKDDWRSKPANAGLYEIKIATISTPKRRVRIQVGGKDVTEPEPLYKDGTLIPYDRRPQDCNLIIVDADNTRPFGTLNLPIGPDPS